METKVLNSVSNVAFEILSKFDKYEELIAKFYADGVRFDAIKYNGELTIFADQSEILVAHDWIEQEHILSSNFSEEEIYLIDMFNRAWCDEFATNAYKTDYLSRIKEHISYISDQYAKGFRSVRTEAEKVRPYGRWIETEYTCLKIKDLDVFLIDVKHQKLGTSHCSNKYGYKLIQDNELQRLAQKDICLVGLEILEDELSEIAGTMAMI